MTHPRTMAALLLGLLLAPLAVALPGEGLFETTGPWPDDADDPPVKTIGLDDDFLEREPGFGCVRVDVVVETRRVEWPGEGCDHPSVNLTWRATLGSGRGSVVLTLEDPQASLPLSNAQPRTAAPIPTAPPRIVIAASFEASWGSGCADARGAFSASVDGERADAAAPPGLFRDVCLLSTAEAAPLLADAVRVAADLATALQPDAASAAEEGARAAGNATLGLFDDGAVASERHDVQYQTPVVAGNLSGDAILALPAEGPRERPAILDASPPDRSAAARLVPDARKPPVPGAPADAPQAPDASPVGPRPAPQPRGERAVVASAPARTMGLDPLPEGILAAGALLLLAAAALYQRARQPDALQHEARAALFGACKDLQRGATAGELAARAGLERKTAEYHLYYLVRVGLLRAGRDARGLWRFALPSVAPPAPAPPGPLDDAVLARIRARPGASAGQIAKELGVGRRSVDRHVKGFLLRGVVESRVHGRLRRLYPVPMPDGFR